MESVDIVQNGSSRWGEGLSQIGKGRHYTDLINLQPVAAMRLLSQ